MSEESRLRARIVRQTYEVVPPDVEKRPVDPPVTEDPSTPMEMK